MISKEKPLNYLNDEKITLKIVKKKKKLSGKPRAMKKEVENIVSVRTRKKEIALWVVQKKRLEKKQKNLKC